MIATALEAFERGWTLYPTFPAVSDATSSEPPLTYAQVERESAALARAFLGAGLTRGDAVALWAANGPRWVVADAACQRAGMISVPLYLASGDADLAHICATAGIRAAVVGTPSLRERWDLTVAPALSEPLRLGVVLTDHEVAPGWITYPEALTTAVGLPLLTSAQISPHDVVTYIFTSGTTGQPKGVILTHDNLAHQVRAVAQLFDVPVGSVNACFLPLSHALERAWSYVTVAHGMHNVMIPDPREVAAVLPRISCSSFVSVPRLYEKVHAVVTSATGVRGAIVAWSRCIGRQHRTASNPSWWLRAQHALAHRLVFAKVEAALGGPKAIMAVGGAPLAREVEEFFADAAQPLFNGYGLTETAPLVTCNSPGFTRAGTVGRAVPGCALRRDHDTGELHVRGPNVTPGYVRDDEATSQLFTSDGWLRTGDVGEIDAEGFVTITGRIKDILVTSQGKNIAPTAVEADLLGHPWCAAAVVIGDARPYLTALIYPEPSHLARTCRDLGVTSDASASSLVVERYTQLAQEAVAHRARHEQVKMVRLLPAALSVERNELTPTLKVRRAAVETMYAELIEDMYGHS